MIVAATMVKLLGAILVGLYLGKKNILDSETCKKLSKIVITISGPCLVFSSVTSMEGTDPMSVIQLIVFGAICYALSPFLGYVFSKVIRVDKNLIGTYILTIVFCNNAFMGFPVVSALYGEEAIFITSVVHLMFNLMFYSLGLRLIQKDAAVKETESFDWKHVVNPGSVAAVAVLIVFFAKLSVPEIVTEPFAFVGGLTMPVSMIVIGANMSQYHLKEIFGEPKIYAVTVMRLVLIPLGIYFAMKPFFSDDLLIKITTLTFAMPVASSVAMASAPYDKPAKVGAISVAFTTIVSLLTIPVWALILG